MKIEIIPYKLLVVEDNPGDYFLLEQYLRSGSLPVEKIFHANNMADATEIAKNNSLDICLLDLSLPDSSGVDSVITINRLLPQTPIVVFSGSSTIEIAIESISNGAMDYLVKGEFNNMLLDKSIQYSIERKRAIEELAHEKIKQQKFMTEIALQVQEREKNEFGRELHDNVAQILATAKMFLGMAKSGKNVSVDVIGKSYEYVTLAIEELRKLSHSLVTPSLSGGNLQKVIKDLVDEINSFKKVRIELLIDEKLDEEEIDKSKELMIYRILQEQLSNIAKYANAKEAFITMKSEKGNLNLTIADKGVGFDTTAVCNGIGLKNIKSRVDHYSGTLKIVSAPGQGCRLEVCVPL